MDTENGFGDRLTNWFYRKFTELIAFLRRLSWFERVLVGFFTLVVVLVLIRMYMIIFMSGAEPYHAQTFEFTDQAGRALELTLSLPDQITVDLDNEAVGVPFTITLVDKSLPEPTAIPAPTPDPAIPTEEPSGQSAETSPPAPTYILDLTITSHNATFSNSEGQPIVPRWVLTPGADVSRNVTANLHPTDYDGEPITLAATISNPVTQDVVSASQNAVIWETHTTGRVRTSFEMAWTFIDQWARVSVNFAVIAAVANFLYRRWQRRNDENKEQQDQLQQIRARIDNLEQQLTQDVSGGARSYHRLHEEIGSQWPDLISDLKTTWETHASKDLQLVLALINPLDSDPIDYDNASRARRKEIQAACEWGYQHLDQDWLEQLANAITLPAEDERRWRAILRPWPSVQAWHPSQYVEHRMVREGLAILHKVKRLTPASTPRAGMHINPFSTAPAEVDTLLIPCRVPLPKINAVLHEAGPAVIFGDTGSGKTAQALLAIYEQLKGTTAFPVYFPNILNVRPETHALLKALGQAIADTLLSYWAILPNDFVQQSPRLKACLVELICRYIGTGKHLTLRLQQTGFSPVGAGEKMQQALIELAESLAFENELSTNDLIVLLSHARPRRFDYTFILVDIARSPLGADPATISAQLAPLLELMPTLAQAGLHLKLFLPAALEGYLPPLAPSIEITGIEWSQAKLEELLTRRLKLVAVEKFADLCDTFEFNQPGPDTHLFNKVLSDVQSTPGTLFRLGSALIQRVGERTDLPGITDDDLRAVLSLDEGVS